MKNSTVQPGGELTKRNLWTFSLGTSGRDMGSGMFTTYLLTYIMFTKDLNPYQFSIISIIMVAARMFDALNDPIMGNILEVTRTRWGKFKPWIFIGMLSSAAVIFVSFNNSLQGWPYVIVFGILYICFSITFTMNDIAYWGMLPSLTSNSKERNKLTSLAILCSGVGGAVLAIVVPTFTVGKNTVGGSAISAYSILSGVFCVMFILCQSITLFGVKEKPLPPKIEGNRVSLKKVVSIIKNNDQISWCAIIFLLHSIGNGLINGGLASMYIYFEFDYRGILFTMFQSLGAATSVVMLLLYTPLSKKISRRKLMKIAVICSTFGYLFILFSGIFAPDSSWMIKYGLITVGNMFSFLGQTTFYLILIISITNTVEYNEYKTGQREEGIISSVRPFITKMGWAFIQMLVSTIYLVVGVKDTSDQIAATERRAKLENLTDTVKARLFGDIVANVPNGKTVALLCCLTLIPILFTLAAFFLYRKKYIIDEDYYQKMVDEIAIRKGEAPSDDIVKSDDSEKVSEKIGVNIT